MALSNIRVEPRREITESLIGIVVVGVIGVGVWMLALWINSLRSTPNMVASILCAMMTVAFGIPLLVALVLFTHLIGEQVSSLLANLGIDPRPKTRYVMTVRPDENGVLKRVRVAVK
jgi:hypothetical protein